MKDVVFVLVQNLVLLDLAGPLDAFRNANNRMPETYRLRFVSPLPKVTAAGGSQFGNLEPLPRRLPRGSIVVLMGAVTDLSESQERETQRVVDWLSATASEAQVLCVCAGSLLAARAGLLAGRECTTHHDLIEKLRRVDPRARVLENRIFVEDGPVCTSAGVTAGLDLALFVISQELGPRVAADIARDLVVYLRRAGDDPALSPWVMHRNHVHPAVHRLQDAIARDPATNWNAATMAAAACSSTRSLNRLFTRYAGCTPLEYVQLVRFGHAKLMVAQSDLELERIAVRAGFRSAQQLRRVWSRWEKLPPSAFRASARMAAGARRYGSRRAALAETD